MRKKYLFISFLLIILNNFIFTYERYIDYELLKNPGPPRLVNNGVLFTLPSGQGKTAFIRTSLDNWEKDHVFKESLYNVLYVFVEYRQDVKSFKYRLNINGFWDVDPYNKNYVEDTYGTKLYLIEIPEQTHFHKRMPIIKDDGEKVKTVTFRYDNPKAKEVNFVCSVDNWSQYSHPMNKNKQGIWEITKYFTHGTYYYFFFVDGEKVSDIDNPDKYRHRIKGQLSVFRIE